MQQENPLNPWLFRHILQQHSYRSRFEIDRDLLQAGFDPRDLDLAWQLVLSGEYPLQLMPTRYKQLERAWQNFNPEEGLNSRLQKTGLRCLLGLIIITLIYWLGVHIHYFNDYFVYWFLMAFVGLLLWAIAAKRR